ncbi:hypothetical protein TUM19329_20450 [Legionella antarctica]|uniref:Uncharacterized protein n=1 Tax=Legionella antarctica TaxID=2708020 RepID=A0A6F8T4S5_9GAMM|nr:hypothetical protein [Legionella antarctica]BCA95684.1 hypothetical protein TUM19329_20450 [Legionella antarctica]
MPGEKRKREDQLVKTTLQKVSKEHGLHGEPDGMALSHVKSLLTFFNPGRDPFREELFDRIIAAQLLIKIDFFRRVNTDVEQVTVSAKQLPKATFNTTIIALDASKNKYFLSNGDKASGSLHETSVNYSVALSVIGGDLYRLILGGSQPEYYIAQAAIPYFNERNNKTKLELCTLYRISKEVTDFEKLTKFNDNLDGLIVILIVSYFLRDPDVIYNLGRAKSQIIKLDPECCFSDSGETIESIEAHLNYIYDPQKAAEMFPCETVDDGFISDDDDDDDALIFGDKWDLQNAMGDTIAEYFREIFTHESTDEKIYESQLFLDYFRSDKRNQELFFGLALILKIDINTYIAEINKTIVPPMKSTKELMMEHAVEDNRLNTSSEKLNFDPVKSQLIDDTKHRLQLFKAAAYKLEGFEPYFEGEEYKESPLYPIYFHSPVNSVDEVSSTMKMS